MRFLGRHKERSGLSSLEISEIERARERKREKEWTAYTEGEKEKERGKWKEIEEPDGAHGRLRVYSRGSIHGIYSGRQMCGCKSTLQSVCVYARVGEKERASEGEAVGTTELGFVEQGPKKSHQMLRSVVRGARKSRVFVKSYAEPSG